MRQRPPEILQGLFLWAIAETAGAPQSGYIAHRRTGQRLTNGLPQGLSWGIRYFWLKMHQHHTTRRTGGGGTREIIDN
ncbi:MAG: hypothetical protein Fur0025_29480 [Oscillatoriaceae cyanobacterium]